MDILHAFVYFETRKPIVLHRDLKPSNVFIMSDGRAVVADFGLACFVAATGEDLTGETVVLDRPGQSESAKSVLSQPSTDCEFD